MLIYFVDRMRDLPKALLPPELINPGKFVFKTNIILFSIEPLMNFSHDKDYRSPSSASDSSVNNFYGLINQPSII